jgi:hypothetical protein
MSEHPTPSRSPEGGRDRTAAGPPVSALAVTGLVIALVPCCPLTGLLGAVLGLLALRRIRLARAGPAARSGERLAMAAIVIGVASAMVWSVLTDQFVRGQEARQNEAMEHLVARVVEAAVAGDAAAVLTAWSPTDAARPSEDAVLAFGAAAADRYGPLQRIAFISIARRGSFFAPEVDASGVFHFERESPLGTARLEMKPVPGSITPAFRMTSLTIEDRVRGDLTLGAPAAGMEDAARDAGPDAGGR